MSAAEVVERLRGLWLKHWSGSGDSGATIQGVDVVVRGDPDAHVFLTARLITWDNGSISNVMETEVFFGRVDLYDDPARDAAAAAAYDVVIAEVLDVLSLEAADGLMPTDLVFGDLVGLGNCETQAQFEKALRTKKRLGRFLP